MLDQEQVAKIVFKMFIPGKTKPKERPRAKIGKNGRPFVYTPSGTTTMENLLRDRAVQWMDANGLDGPHRGPVRIAVVSLFEKPLDYWEGKEPQGRYGDWDNLAKTVCDALNKILYADDAQIIDGRSIKRYNNRAGVYIVAELLPIIEKPKKGRKQNATTG